MSDDSGLTVNEKTTLLIDYWKQSSDVHQHLNDVSMKLRNFAVVVFSGFLTGVGLAVHNNISISIFGSDISAGVLFALAGMIATQLIHFMDTYWYHVFLKGAVSTSSSIEKIIAKTLGIPELSGGISNSSQEVCVVSICGFLYLPVGWKPWLKYFFIFKKSTVNSTQRHKIFYRWLLAIFIITGIGSNFTHPGQGSNLDKNDNSINVLKVGLSELKQVVSDKGSNSSAIHVISGTNVRVRQQPSLQGEIKNLLPIGKNITLTDEKTKQSWVHVVYIDTDGSASGWVHRDYIATIK